MYIEKPLEGIFERNSCNCKLFKRMSNAIRENLSHKISHLSALYLQDIILGEYDY